MKINNYQHGVGLIEVLVAMLVLAIGVLGFVALQYRAIEASSESTYRVQAVNIARDLAERIRVNRGGVGEYVCEFRNADTSITCPAEQAIATQATLRAFARNCIEENCNSTEMADFDVAQVAVKAETIGMTVNMLPCQGNVNERQCIYVAWNDTSATNGDGADDCTNGAAYNANSTCLIMEVY